MKGTGTKGIAAQLIARTTATTPRFFKKLRIVGLTLTAIGAALVTAPVVLPAAVVTIGGYLTVAGSVLGAVSQLTVNDESKLKRRMENVKP